MEGGGGKLKNTQPTPYARSSSCEPQHVWGRLISASRKWVGPRGIASLWVVRPGQTWAPSTHPVASGAPGLSCNPPRRAYRGVLRGTMVG